MKYFNDITNIEEAKLHYRKLAKQFHPDAGGTASEFQKLQEEYKTVLLQIQQNQHKVILPNLKQSAEKELITELGKLAKVLIKKQVPQDY
jgi:surfactin synthase thioesterase subunit